MIKKVLIAEDHESTNISLQKTLEELGIANPDYVYYCDDALLKIQTAKQNNQTYDLLITDLYFEADHNFQKILNGSDLIKAARQIQPELRVLVFSAEHRPAIIDTLFTVVHIDGFVRKARNDAKDLKQAIEYISLNQTYRPRHLDQLIRQKNMHDFSDFDTTIISLLAQGVRQKDIPAQLEARQIKPSGISSVEKRLNHIKEVLSISTNEQLVAHCKDIGII